MKYGLIVFSLFVALMATSCFFENNNVEERRDSTVHFFYDTVASLGTEVIIHYENDKPAWVSILFQEERRSTIVEYLFLKDSILVSESDFFYNNALSTRKDVLNEVFWKDDTDSVNFFRYVIDYNGDIIWNNDSLNDTKNHYSVINSLLSTY